MTTSLTTQVAYATALDVFVIMCFMAVFTALIEFAFINFLDMFIRYVYHQFLSNGTQMNNVFQSLFFRRLKHRDLVRVQVKLYCCDLNVYDMPWGHFI